MSLVESKNNFKESLISVNRDKLSNFANGESEKVFFFIFERFKSQNRQKWMGLNRAVGVRFSQLEQHFPNWLI